MPPSATVIGGLRRPCRQTLSLARKAGRAFPGSAAPLYGRPREALRLDTLAVDRSTGVRGGPPQVN